MFDHTGTAEDTLADMPVESEEQSLRKSVESAFESIKRLVKASARPLPSGTGDGSYLPDPEKLSWLKDLGKVDFRDVMVLKEVVEAGVKHERLNDKDYLMERIIETTADFGTHSKTGQAMSNGLVDLLWHDLPHPPLSYMGDEYKYRQADGSKNNVRWPQLGKAGMPYARSVQPNPEHLQAFHKPDPGVLFDSLLARTGFQPHPNRISSVLFYLASVIIHDIFKTSHKDPGISMTSSYLDLAPLYGSCVEEQEAMRTFRDGQLKPDCFSEKRILGFPPGVGVLLIMFNRWHNWIAQQLAAINEGGRFNRPEGKPPSLETTEKSAKDKKRKRDPWEKYDNDLFQTARLITCGLYINIILKDYVRVILNLHRTESTWNLDPRLKQGKQLIGGSGAGIGNQVSAEFNLVYRWHSCISEIDAQWTDDLYQSMFPESLPEDVTVEELMEGLGRWESTVHPDPQQRRYKDRCLNDIPRGKDGRLDDQVLVDILQTSIEDVAGSFGANRVPKVLRAVEILGIKQARSWNLATLNEFRNFFNLKPHKEFKDINPDPEVYEQLRHLYSTPDQVELYPGLVVEAAKKRKDPGSGLCPSFTTSRAILSDAVSLVRGDRFYTVDYTPNNLTNFGYKAAEYDDKIDQGHVFYKLILRAFPQHFKTDSVYAHFPLVNPEESKKILTGLNKERNYSYDPPKYVPKPLMIHSYKTGTEILNDRLHYGITWGPTVTMMMQNSGKAYGSDFMLSGDSHECMRSRDMMKSAMYKQGWEQEVRKFYEWITIELLREKKYFLARNNEVDIVRDVGNLAHVHFSAELFNLPLKTKKHPHRQYTEKELYMVMALVFICIFFDKDPVGSAELRRAARENTQALGKILEARLHPLAHDTPFDRIREMFDVFHERDPLPEMGKHIILELIRSERGLKDIVWSQLLGTAGGMVSIQGQLFAQVLDFYLQDENKHHWNTIQNLAEQNIGDADDQILHYFMEGARIASSVALPREVKEDTTIQIGGKDIRLEKGSKVVVNLVSCSHDPEKFPNPDTVDLTRHISSYIHYGWGPHRCLGMEMSMIALPTMLKTVARLKNLRRAPGPPGELKSVDVGGGLKTYLAENGATYWPFPTTMKVRWDGDIPESRGYY